LRAGKVEMRVRFPLSAHLAKRRMSEARPAQEAGGPLRAFWRNLMDGDTYFGMPKR